MMTSNDYVIRLEQKLICKEIVIKKREHQKELMFASKEAHVVEKVGKEIAKHNQFDEKAMNFFL